jgi:hypothetical protein
VIWQRVRLWLSQASHVSSWQENFALSSQLSAAYFMQDCSDMVEVAEHLCELPLSLPDMYVFAIR